MSVPTGDPQLDMLLAQGVKAYLYGEAQEVRSSLYALLRHHGAIIKYTSDSSEGDLVVRGGDRPPTLNEDDNG